MSSLDVWQGEFGTEYTNRQENIDPSPVFRDVFDNRWIGSILEVGCNRGDNLIALHSMASRVEGVEPNVAAYTKAVGRRLKVHHCDASSLPYVDGEFDAVFTAGVLIHINPYHLERAMYEIHRVSRQYILSIEYEAPLEVGVEYRGIPDGIWKRDYGEEWLVRYRVNLVRYWPAVDFEGTAFEGCSAWLLDKRPPVSGP